MQDSPHPRPVWFKVSGCYHVSPFDRSIYFDGQRGEFPLLGLTAEADAQVRKFWATDADELGALLPSMQKLTRIAEVMVELLPIFEFDEATMKHWELWTWDHGFEHPLSFHSLTDDKVASLLDESVSDEDQFAALALIGWSHPLARLDGVPSLCSNDTLFFNCVLPAVAERSVNKDLDLPQSWADIEQLIQRSRETQAVAPQAEVEVEPKTATQGFSR